MLSAGDGTLADVSRFFDCRDADQREDGLRTAAVALGRGGLVVMPTDTVYGLAADAFNAEAVAGLLAAKGRDRTMPPPVLVSGRDVLKALTTRVGADVEALADAFWPGGLTIICWAQPSLAWDLGETAGTVAVRMPDHPVALGLLRSCGPLAVSSANLSGRAAALTAGQARDQLGDRVQVYLDDGETEGTLPSSIIDATGGVPALVRAGAIGYYRLSQVLPDLIDRTDHPTTPPTDDPTDPTDPTDDPGDDAATAEAPDPRRHDRQYDAEQALLEQHEQDEAARMGQLEQVFRARHDDLPPEAGVR
jgi:tRNA threonylcarbamoyl adenosine modification protein (Sua5/YciO/YrdC/YwlC family)